MMRNTLLLSLAFLVMLSVAVSCKPTENNYRAAYDAAIKKRQAEEQDPDIPMATLTRPDAPSIYHVGNDTIYFRRDFMKVYYPEDASLEPYNVVIAKYKMGANATAQADNFRKEGYNSLVLSDREQSFLVVLTPVNSFEEANETIKAFTSKYPDLPLVGLYGTPIVVIPSSLRVQY